jgi:TonB family protein
MRWLKLFLSPTANSACRACRLWLASALVLIIAAGVASSMTPACGPNSPARVLRVDRHAAKKLLLSETKPSYPLLARINYIRGHVQLLVTVDCQGRVTQIHVIRGHPFLAAAALDAIRRWVYRPFETKAGPAVFQTLIDINFSLVGSDLTLPNLPPQPDKFLARGVRPPKLLSHQRIEGANGWVRLRVLVNKKGHVLDSTLLSGNDEELAAARQIVAHWKFRPARWGTLNVPWYADVSVPIHQVQPKPPERDPIPSSPGVTPPDTFH